MAAPYGYIYICRIYLTTTFPLMASGLFRQCFHQQHFQSLFWFFRGSLWMTSCLFPLCFYFNLYMYKYLFMTDSIHASEGLSNRWPIVDIQNVGYDEYTKCNCVIAKLRCIYIENPPVKCKPQTDSLQFPFEKIFKIVFSFKLPQAIYYTNIPSFQLWLVYLLLWPPPCWARLTLSSCLYKWKSETMTTCYPKDSHLSFVSQCQQNTD